MGEEPSDENSERATWELRSDEVVLTEALEEARRSYDKEIESINDVDEKAMRAARTGFLILGIAVSGVAIFGSETLGDLSTEVTLLGGSGLALIFFSALLALGTYTATEYPTGIGRDHRNAALHDGYSKDEWLEFLIDEYGEWTDEVTEMSGANAQYLEYTVFFQSVGLLSLSLAVTVGYLHRIEGVHPQDSLKIMLLYLALFGLIGYLIAQIRECISD